MEEYDFREDEIYEKTVTKEMKENIKSYEYFNGFTTMYEYYTIIEHNKCVKDIVIKIEYEEEAKINKVFNDLKLYLQDRSLLEYVNFLDISVSNFIAEIKKIKNSYKIIPIFYFDDKNFMYLKEDINIVIRRSNYKKLKGIKKIIVEYKTGKRSDKNKSTKEAYIFDNFYSVFCNIELILHGKNNKFNIYNRIFCKGKPTQIIFRIELGDIISYKSGNKKIYFYKRRMKDKKMFEYVKITIGTYDHMHMIKEKIIEKRYDKIIKKCHLGEKFYILSIKNIFKEEKEQLVVSDINFIPKINFSKILIYLI